MLKPFLVGFTGVLVAAFLVYLIGGVVIVYRTGEIEVAGLEHPSMSELQSFLEVDKTDRITAIITPGSILNPLCVDFSITLRTNATKAGWDFDVVIMNFEEGVGHVICGVRLDNGAYYFVEPQNDNVFPELDVGDLYQIGDNLYTVSYIGIID